MIIFPSLSRNDINYLYKFSAAYETHFNVIESYLFNVYAGKRKEKQGGLRGLRSEQFS